MPKFDFLEKGLWRAFTPHFAHDFSRKIFLVLFFINLPNFIAWLFLRLEMLGNICIIIICCTVCEIISFEINLSFPIKPFSYVTRKSGWKCKFWRSESVLIFRKVRVQEVKFRLFTYIQDWPSYRIYQIFVSYTTMFKRK